jgi:hypothetical protein
MKFFHHLQRIQTLIDYNQLKIPLNLVMHQSKNKSRKNYFSSKRSNQAKATLKNEPVSSTSLSNSS